MILKFWFETYPQFFHYIGFSTWNLGKIVTYPPHVRVALGVSKPPENE